MVCVKVPWLRSHLPHYGANCLCGEETVAFGNECLKEEQIPLAANATGESVCLFLGNANKNLQIPDRKGSVSGKGLVEWLQDVTISGKHARLRLDKSGFDLAESTKVNDLEELIPGETGKFEISDSD